jgi:deoxyribodipyrimidine photolyase-related protein
VKQSVLIFGDQLSLGNTALLAAGKDDTRVLLVESQDLRRRDHLHKHVFRFASMRHFAAGLAAEGWDVDYHRLEETPCFRSAVLAHLKRHGPEEFLAMEPNCHGEQVLVEEIARESGVHLQLTPTNHFVTPRDEFLRFAQGKKRLLMEAHYRKTRQRLGILMDADGNPEGGAWNFDASNRKGLGDWKKDGAPRPPMPVGQAKAPDEVVESVKRDVECFFPDGAGTVDTFAMPVTRDDALAGFRDFLERRLPLFGDYQDLMLEDSPTMFHSLVSGPMNLGLLHPMECVVEAEEAWRAGRAPIAAVEGFIRQIIGWREFINGVYWLKMPGYTAVNALGANRTLPDFFRTGATGMHCLKCTLGQAHDTAYNHHIQRLMILGNFCLLAGIDPQQAHEWFLETYIDAHEWVMAANVLGMALHADGGFMATKPYAGSAAYISRMSNYCAGCDYDPKAKHGAGACPFNLLYWDFYNRHARRFAGNPRTSMMVRSWEKRLPAEKNAILRDAENFLQKLDQPSSGG